MASKHVRNKKAGARAPRNPYRLPAVVPFLEPWITEAFSATFGGRKTQMTHDHIRALAVELLLTRGLRLVEGPDDSLWGDIEKCVTATKRGSRGEGASK